jgi:hypothetical protein
MEGSLTISICSLLYLLCAMINLVRGCLGEKGSKTSFGSFPQYDFDQLPRLSKPSVHAYRILHGSIYFPFRLLSKYYKWRLPAILNGSPGSQLKNPQRSDVKDSTKPDHDIPRLPMELVILITQDLHYVDLVNLRQSSKYLCTAFFGNQQPLQVVKELRQFACNGGAEPLSHCAVCQNPGCTVRLPCIAPLC